MKCKLEIFKCKMISILLNVQVSMDVDFDDCEIDDNTILEIRMSKSSLKAIF